MTEKTSFDGVTKFFIVVIGLVVIGIVLRELSHICIPLLIAVFLFFVFSPFNNWLIKKKIPMFLVILLDLAITFAVLYGIGRVVVDSFFQFADGLPVYGDKLSSLIRSAAVSLGITDTFFTQFSFDNLVKSLNLQDILSGLFSSTFSLLGSVLFVLFFFVFVLSGNKTIYKAIEHRYISKKAYSENTDKISESGTQKDLRIRQLEDTFTKITNQIQRYIIAKVGVNLSAGVITTIALSLIGVDFPIVWGLFVFLFNFIPTIGSAAALVFPVLFTLVQFDSFGIVILVLLVMIGIQTLAFNVAEPMIMGKRLDLNPLLILLSVLLWGYIWGIVGMLLSVPLTAIIKIIISNSDSPNMEFFEQLMSQEKK